MSLKQKELEQLLALKKKQELDQLSLQEKQEWMKLEKKYAEFIQMNSQQMEEELKRRGPVQDMDVKSPDLNPILEDYKKQYGKESWYKKPEIREDGSSSLVFPSEEATGNFFQEQAAKNRSFILVDAETNKVLGYSNGDGKLYNGDGSIYSGGKFQRSDKDCSKFEMPERARSQMGMTG